VARAGKGRPALVLLDLNSPEFQSQLFALDRALLAQVVEILARLRKMAWTDVYRSSGIKWEKIGGSAPNGEPLYSLRITQKVRAVGFREGDYLRLVSLHPDHDSAYD
jgi:hypothetical protein